ncbi:MAG: ATP phosphoribosyltransferase [Thermoguttaceae bacterium]
MQSNGTLRIAIQKSGRLSEASTSLLRQMGLQFETHQERLLSPCRNMPIDILFLRDDDIPEYVQDGVADLGIVGSNVLDERAARIERLLPLEFGFCSLCLASPERGQYKSVDQLQGKRIATSYPQTLGRYLAGRGMTADVVVLKGCVEIAPALEVADAICDLVSSGSTLRTHGLTILDTVARCQSVLIGRPEFPPESRSLAERLLLRARGVQEARKYKYIMFNAPTAAIEPIKSVLPGCKSPTIVPLAEPGFVAVHSMVLEETFWDVVEKIRDCGGTDILVTPVEKFLR